MTDTTQEIIKLLETIKEGDKEFILDFIRRYIKMRDAECEEESVLYDIIKKAKGR